MEKINGRFICFKFTNAILLNLSDFRMAEAPMVAVLSYEAVINYARKVSEFRGPTDVHSFVTALNRTLNLAYDEFKDSKDTEECRSFLQGCYRLAVVQDRDFKRRIPVGGAEAIKNELIRLNQSCKKGINLPVAHRALQLEVKNDMLFCLLIRGQDGDTDTRSMLVNVGMEDEEKNGIVIPVMTPKLFQACISILCVIHQCHRNLPPAKLGGNVVKACTIKASEETEDNWGIHAHSGLKFVANYIHHMKPESPAKPRMPAIHHVLMIAYRMDQSFDAHSKTPAWKKGRFSTLESVFQSTGMTKEDMESCIRLIVPRQWGTQFAGLDRALEKLEKP
ncbi:unnamed protein product [Cuscuta epithymum]|uniref:Nucleoprotein n=1 Tax=Cuscuta epithymum TaxID=186058 RepID=A0AAV0EEH1_9ASTE|nr:unnamed protein product [Cuscuta epithymum]